VGAGVQPGASGRLPLSPQLLCLKPGVWGTSRPTPMQSKRTPKTWLVGDIGGTNTRVALFDAASQKPLRELVRQSREHSSFEAIVDELFASLGDARPEVAVFGVAGPVVDGTAHFTNLGWKLDEKELAKRLGVPRVVLLNDLVAAARGCLVAPAESIVAITPELPSRDRGNLAVLAAGTGLGEARLVWDGQKHLALATEGGHADFAPQTPLELELWQFLSARYPDHVSYERVLSGPGLGNLFEFFASRSDQPPRAVSKRLGEGDRNVAIVELGISRGYRPAARAVDTFAALYGAEAGNVALRELATGGVFLTGSLGRAIVLARHEVFLERFRRKGRFHGMMSKIPVAVVTDPHVGVLGALDVARELTTERAPSTKAAMPAPAKRRARST